MKSIIKNTLSLLLAASMVASLTACSGNAVSSSTNDTPSLSSSEVAPPSEDTEKKPETVTVMTYPMTDESMQIKWDSIKAKFAEMNPGTTLNIVHADVSIEGGKLTTILNSGIDLPDIINTSSGPSRIGALAPTGVILPLDDLYKKNGWDEKINPGALALRTELEGQHYEVPYTMDSIACYYNKNIFKELGLEVPTTYEEFVNICEKTKAAGYEPIALGSREGYSVGWMFGNILQSACGLEGARNLVTGKAKWTEPGAVKAIATFNEWVKKGYISETASTKGEQDALYAFLNNQSAMYFIGTWVITTAKASNMLDSIGCFPLPSQVGEKTYPTSGLGSSFVVPAALKSTVGAEMWLNFVLSDEFAQLMANNEDNCDIVASVAFSNATCKNPVLQQGKGAISENAGCNPSVFIGVETKNAYFQNLRGLLSGLGTPEEVADNIQVGQDQDLAS